MKLKAYIFLTCFLVAGLLNAQRLDEQAYMKRYTQKDLLDSIDGIKIYNKLIESIGGDSITYNKEGYNKQGWNEEYYLSGKLLHRGYYKDGKLLVFKNFFENGQCERSVVNPDPLRCNIDVYYENGKQRTQVNYYNGKPQKKYEYYTNGLPKYVEENEKEMKYLTVKKTWYDNGQIENAMELQDSKNKKYSQKLYYASGQLKEEGSLVLSEDGKTYVKDGLWYFYDHSGKNRTTQLYMAGVLKQK